ncbi:MAG: D-tyrosyl-tRNA(Tyr) deacylase [Clostridia bacterium]|nr:D-tyrosyl-tRNA(Tyr) deacylase [Clostridia bacterium]
MKTVIQRVTNANVKVDNEIVGEIKQGLVVLLAISDKDEEKDVEKMASRIVNLRIFSDNNGKMNLSIKDINGELLVISQFTLYADCSKGNRPSFSNAGKPEHANKLYEYFIKTSKELGMHTEHGVFGADMKVSLTNDGPVTIELEN